MTSAFGGQHSIQLSYGCVRFIFGRAGRALHGCFAAVPGRRSLRSYKENSPALQSSGVNRRKHRQWPPWPRPEWRRLAEL